MGKSIFMKEQNYSKNFILSNIVISLIIISLALSVYIINFPFEFKLMIMAWLGNICLVWGLGTFYKIKGTNINPYSFFYISYFLFSFGQVFLFSIGIKNYFYNLIYLYREEEIISYCLFFLVSTCFFIHGALLAIRKDKSAEKIYKLNYELNNKNNITIPKAVKVTSLFLIFISAPVYITDLINNISTSINFGYRAIYEQNSMGFVQNILSELKHFFIPSMLFLLVLYKNNKYKEKIILFLFLLIIIGQFVIGGRTESMALVLSLVFLWNSEMKKMKPRNKIIIFIFVIITILLLPVIQDFRGSDMKSLETFFELLFLKSQNSLFTQLISELGTSMEPWLMVNRIIPEDVGFYLGESYLASFLTVIPSFLLWGISFTEKAALAQWLMKTLNMSYGPGFSIMAEAYYNFGWFGVPFLTLVGWFYFKLISNNMFKGPIIKYKNVLSAITLFFFITSARSSLYLTIRRELYFVLLPIFLIYLINDYLKKKN